MLDRRGDHRQLRKVDEVARRQIAPSELASGELAWEDTLPASAQATPMTYRTRRGGRQFLVIAAGGHSLMHSSMGDYIVAYALPNSGKDQL